MTDPFKKKREKMVETQIIARGVKDAAVLGAMRTVPRELFVPESIRDSAYHDCALPIAERQTISQPYVVAMMIEALRLSPGDKVLEIGAGSGYAAAILAEITPHVFTVERIETLAQTASVSLKNAGYDGVQVRHGDGSQGWAEEAPFDAILVSAGGPDIPASLKMQLAVGGRMVIPVGQSESYQTLTRVTRIDAENYEEEALGDVRFVPLIGEEGWAG